MYYDYLILLELVKDIVSQRETGYKRIGDVFKVYKAFSRENTNFVSFTMRANEMLKDDTQESIPFQQKYYCLNHSLFDILVKLFTKAQNDRSIRSDLNAVQLAGSSILMITGFLDIVSTTGEQFKRYFHLDEKDIIEFTLNRMLETLKAAENGGEKSVWSN